MTEQAKKVKEILDSKYKIEGVNPEYHTQIAQQIVEALHPEQTDMRKAVIKVICGHCIADECPETCTSYIAPCAECISQVKEIIALRPEMKVLNDEELLAVDEPCLKNEPCPFGIADETANGEKDKCVLCRERAISRATVEGNKEE